MSEIHQVPPYPYLTNRVDLVNGEWEEVELFSIAGWFCEDYEGTPFKGQSVAFGGYFKLCGDAETGSIKGELVDLLGRSEITGNLWKAKDDSDVLCFSKIYRESSIFPGLKFPVIPAVGYHFRKTQNGWEGQFVIQSVYRGRTFCQITPVVSNAFGILDKLTLDPKWFPGAELSFLDG